MKKQEFSILAKVIIFQLVFLLLHYLYDWLPNELTTLFSGINESVYQHMKIGFYSYILVASIEYLWSRRSITSRKGFFFSRLFTVVYLPWVLLVMFLISPIVFIKIESIPVEIIFANVTLILASVSSLLVEKQVEKAEPGTSFQIVLLVLFLLTLTQFVVFTYRLPWFDLFATPAGW